MKGIINNLAKSKSDKRNYLYKQLPNRLKCLLIEDKEADKSSAAMNVNIGSLLDPREFYGLAHFLEHMLFMGTEKYTSENDFMEFLNQNSGHSNAFTDLDSTNYFFEVSNEAFIPAVDRFGQFFISPLFNKSAVEREMRAVESENKKNLQSDMWRFLQLMRSQGHANSIFTRFSTGNLETLNKPSIRDALLDFHGRYYSSNLMSLVMLSPKPLMELESITDNLFTSVPFNNSISSEILQKDYASIYPYDESNLGNFYKIIPVREQDELTFYWVINENLNPFYDKKPLTYVSSLLGHEGPNSLTSSLVKDDLITSLSCGYSTVANTFTQFYIHIDLTRKGLKNYDHIISRIFYYINKLRERDINKSFFEEIRQIQKIKFDFKNKEDPTNYSSELAHSFTHYNPEDILTGPYLIKHYDEDLIRKYFNSLQMKNLNIYLSSKTFSEIECSKTEEWYGTKFDKEKFINNRKFKTFLEKNINIKHKLDYPPENKFIPKDFDVLIPKADIKYPQKIFESINSAIWYKQDNTFLLPKAAVILQINLNKNILSSKEYDVICSIWNSIFDNELKELTYMAGEANIGFKLFFNLEGIYLQVSGFNSSIKNVMYEILNKLKEIITTKSKIENLKGKLAVQIEDHIKSYKNFYYSAPYSQVMTYLDVFLREHSSTPETKLEFLKDIEKEMNITEEEGKVKVDNVDVNKEICYNDESTLNNPYNSENIFEYFMKTFLKESSFNWLIQGNITSEESIEIAKMSEQILLSKTLKESDSPSFRISQIPENKNFYFILPSGDPNNQNSSIVSFFQAGYLNEHDRCCLYLIESLLREKFFDELRTKQTLGYIVKLAYREFRKIEGFICVVQSSVKSPEDIQQRITEFIQNNNLKLNLDDDVFELHRQSVITDLKQKDLKLMEEVMRNFSEIKRGDYEFNRKLKQLEILEKIKKEDVQNMFEQVFVLSPRRLDIELLAENHKSENETFEKINNQKSDSRIKVHSVEQFKKSVGLYPDYYSVLSKIEPKF